MKNLLLIISLCCFFPENYFSQNTIWLLNSKKITLSDYKTDSKQRKIIYLNHRNKEKFIYLDHIFSITDSKGSENILFTPRKIENDFYSVDGMRSYLIGQNEAYRSNRTPLASIGGFATGSFFAWSFSVPFYSIVPAAGYTTLIGLTKPSEKRIIKKFPEYALDTNFIKGYQEAGTGKRSYNAAKTSVAGILAGIIAVLISNTL